LIMDWHEIRDPQDAELDHLAERYRLHPLHVEDCRHRGQNAKVEESRGYMFAVFKTVSIAPDGSLRVGDLDIFLGRDFLITVEEEDCPPARRVIEQARGGASGLRADQAFYRIADGMVDSYLPVLDHFSEVIDELEDQVLDRPAPEALARIFETKRSLILLRRLLANSRDAAGQLQRSEAELIHREMWPFLRDIYDHVSRHLDLVEMQRDLLSGALDIYLSSVANRTNQVMKVLTVLGTIALPALVVSGIYGMNVKGLPAAESPYGLVLVGAAMVGSTVALLYILRRFRWL
jgi:magnesium transporter